jgi:ribonucleoside-diphosphate reductase beta chain
MRSISTRVEDETADELEGLADERGSSVSQVTRDLIRKGLEYDEIKSERNRLERQLVATNSRVDDVTELVAYVDAQRELELETDRERLIADEPTAAEFDEFRELLAQFGAGGEAVTEDLAPLLVALEDINDQMFVSSQLYEEAKHTQFFDRYWREVVDPVAEALGHEITVPTDQRYFNDDFVAIFDATEAAMGELLTDDSSEKLARAISHYHLTIESVLAQSGYFTFQSIFSDSGRDDVARREWPELPGIIDGITYIRSDEGRHVGWGMQKVRSLIQDGDVEPQVVRDTLQELMPRVVGASAADSELSRPEPVAEFSRDKLTRRIEIITDTDATLPTIEELTRVEGGDDAGGH